VVNAYGNHQQPELIVDATRSLLSAVEAASVIRLIAVGGAGSLGSLPAFRS
jgi:putative NADH-flavin reductase